MSQVEQQPAPAAGEQTGSVWQWVRANKHFLAASLILLTTAIGWGAAKAFLKVVFRKESVPWPAAVQVDEDHRLVSLATSFGLDDRYRRVEADGVLRKQRDGIPDGETIHREDLLDALSIATTFDRTRYGSRRGNWYVARTYRDAQDQGGYRYWQLDVTYYTGGLDKVPHVGERCIVAGGGTVLGNETTTVEFDTVGAPEGWRPKMPCRRITYVVNGPYGPVKYVQYYMFSLNGRPETDWKQVRLKLQNPFERYGYFAKIQFGPRHPIRNVAKADQAAQAFILAALPEVLKTLPMPSDIERLKANEGK